LKYTKRLKAKFACIIAIHLSNHKHTFQNHRASKPQCRDWATNFVVWYHDDMCLGSECTPNFGIIDTCITRNQTRRLPMMQQNGNVLHPLVFFLYSSLLGQL